MFINAILAISARDENRAKMKGLQPVEILRVTSQAVLSRTLSALLPGEVIGPPSRPLGSETAGIPGRRDMVF